MLVNICDVTLVRFPLVGKKNKHGWLQACNDLRLSVYAANFSDEARKRYRNKLKYTGRYLPDPYEMSSGWLHDPAVWPDLQFGDITAT
jgi:hypothetical protein